jgi:hypothetical protein
MFYNSEGYNMNIQKNDNNASCEWSTLEGGMTLVHKIENTWVKI